MTPAAWIVVKVGGSLFDWPELRVRLRTFLSQLDSANILLVPGGGATADVVRALDRTHQLGEEASHWLAIQALSVNARFLQALLPEAKLIGDLSEREPQARNHACWILDALPFFLDDERRPDHLPHLWQVTSDSLAVRAAIVANARELILLKSMTWKSSGWTEASRAGVVDAYFAQAMRQAPAEMRVRWINLRATS